MAFFVFLENILNLRQKVENQRLNSSEANFLEITTFFNGKSRNQNKFAHKQISAHTYTAKNWTIIFGLQKNFVLFQYVLTQIYLGRSHICRSLFLAILGR